MMDEIDSNLDGLIKEKEEYYKLGLKDTKA